MRIFVSAAILSTSVALSACAMDGDLDATSNRTNGPVGNEKLLSLPTNPMKIGDTQPTSEDFQLHDVSAMVRAAMASGDVVPNPFDDSGTNPYVFVSETARDAFYQEMDNAGLTVDVELPTMGEIAQMPARDQDEVSLANDVQTEDSCGIGHECSSVGYCEGGILDCSYGYCNFDADYGAYTEFNTYFPGTFVPFSAEVHLPEDAPVLADYNFDQYSPRALYIDTLSSSSSANRSKHRCCYWIVDGPTWTIDCWPYFYNEL